MNNQTDENCRNGFDSRRLRLSLPVIRVFAIVAGAFHLFLIIPDLDNIGAEFAGWVLSLRIGFALMAAALLIYLHRFSTFRGLAMAVTLLEAVAVAQFLLMFTLYPAPDFMIQLLGMMLLVVFVFLVPNYWALMVGVALGASSAFFILAYETFAPLDASRLEAGMVYVLLVIVTGAVFARYSQRNQKREIRRLAELEHACETDPLTKTGNRNMLGETGGRVFDSVVRQGRTLSLVLMDVDNLKQFNDAHGHIFGDALLVEIANITRSHLRKDDICVRWGGDEFMLLLPDTGILEAQAAAERIRQSISAKKFDRGIRPSCSFGVAALERGQSLEELIKEADANMYHAKKVGKNTVVISG